MGRKDLARRYLVFALGVLVSATGIAFITRAGLGTSPISSLPFVLSLVTPPSMGVYTFAFNMSFLVLEALLLRRFTWVQALQIPATLLFSGWLDLSLRVIPSNYGGAYLLSVGYLLLGCVVMAAGVALEVKADVSMLPGEAFVRALSRKIHKDFGNVKVCFDSSLTLIAAVLALFMFHKLNGVREGTVFSALAVGQLVKLFTRHMGRLGRWLYGAKS
jgi:uncharacterized membrane protein YczE